MNILFKMKVAVFIILTIIACIIVFLLGYLIFCISDDDNDVDNKKSRKVVHTPIGHTATRKEVVDLSTDGGIGENINIQDKNDISIKTMEHETKPLDEKLKKQRLSKKQEEPEIKKNKEKTAKEILDEKKRRIDQEIAAKKRKRTEQEELKIKKNKAKTDKEILEEKERDQKRRIKQEIAAKKRKKIEQEELKIKKNKVKTDKEILEEKERDQKRRIEQEIAAKKRERIEKERGEREKAEQNEIIKKRNKIIEDIMRAKLIKRQKTTNKQTKASTKRNYSKNEFLDAAFAHEINYRGIIEDAIQLNFKDVSDKKSGIAQDMPNLIIGKDSILEALRQLVFENPIKVAMNTAGNEYFVGGGFTYLKNKRPGYGAQEESVMSIIPGLMKSLLVHAKKDEENRVIRGKDSRYMYKEDVFKNNIMVSRNLNLRLPSSLNKTEKDYIEGHSLFSDFIENINYDDRNPGFIVYRECFINIYTICAYDRRNKGRVDYDKIQKDTENQISTMLIHAAEDNCKVAVVTIPGSGVFSWRTRGGNDPDEEYLNRVITGTVDAIFKFGASFNKVILC